MIRSFVRFWLLAMVISVSFLIACLALIANDHGSEYVLAQWPLVLQLLAFKASVWAAVAAAVAIGWGRNSTDRQAL